MKPREEDRVEEEGREPEEREKRPYVIPELTKFTPVEEMTGETTDFS